MNPTIRTATKADIMDALEKSEHVCPSCGNGFIPTRTWQSFCSQKCRMTFHNATSIIARLEDQRILETRALKQEICVLQEEVIRLQKLVGETNEC